VTRRLTGARGTCYKGTNPGEAAGFAHHLMAMPYPLQRPS
jgi:hypothetical protein